MASNTPAQPHGQPPIMMGGDGASYANGSMLKQVSVPVETLLGATNAALCGAALSVAVSAAVSFAQHDRASAEGVGQSIIKNLAGSKHMWPMLAFTTALTALGGVVRYSRARMHNQWSDRHYAFLEQQSGSHAEAVENSRGKETPDAGAMTSPAR